MKYAFILSLILTIRCVVGSENPITLNAETIDRPAMDRVFMFKLKVNGNMVLLDNCCPAVFQIECAASASNVQIFTLMKKNLISTFGLNANNFETMIFVLLNRQLQLLNKNLHEPGTIMSIVCIPTCELLTKDYPKKNVVMGKYTNFAVFFLRQIADGKYELYHRQ